MEIKNRTDLVNETVTRVINNAPVSELLRVYSQALNAELKELSDEDLLSALEKANYQDLIEKYTNGEAEASE